MSTQVAMGTMLAGKYKVERVLGQGGMGMVVAAMHQQLEQRVALKFLLPSGSSDDETVTRFLREARAAVRLRSEHVARVLDVGALDNGSPYIVMEYLEGNDLAGLLETRLQLSIEEAVDYLLQACEAIAEAHAAGIVHRDLKPANLFLTARSDGSPCIKVLDFGISKLMNPADASMSMTRTTSVMGTPYYMSPEQLRSSKRVDPRSDIWALGMILYELITGTVAFARETLPELCAAILTDPIVPPSQLRPELPPALERVLMQALEKDPAARWQTVATFAQALAPFALGGEKAAQRVTRILSPPEPHAQRAVATAPLGTRMLSASLLDTEDAPSPQEPSTPVLQPAAQVAPPPAVQAAPEVRARVSPVAHSIVSQPELSALVRPETPAEPSSGPVDELPPARARAFAEPERRSEPSDSSDWFERSERSERLERSERSERSRRPERASAASEAPTPWKTRGAVLAAVAVAGVAAYVGFSQRSQGDSPASATPPAASVRPAVSAAATTPASPATNAAAAASVAATAAAGTITAPAPTATQAAPTATAAPSTTVTATATAHATARSPSTAPATKAPAGAKGGANAGVPDFGGRH